MPRKHAKKPRPPEKTSSLRPRLILGLQILLPVLLGITAIVSITLLGREAGQNLTDDSRFSIPFADIVCKSPEPISRELFLAEVRYLSNMPESISLIDRETPEKIRQAFALHPWVESVESCRVSVDRQLHVDLKYRKPRMVVRISTGDQESERAIDSHAILLPRFEIPKSLPRLIGIPAPAAVSSGQRLRDPLVQRALDLLLEFDAEQIEFRETNWRITQTNGRVLTVKR